MRKNYRRFRVIEGGSTRCFKRSILYTILMSLSLAFLGMGLVDLIFAIDTQPGMIIENIFMIIAGVFGIGLSLYEIYNIWS